MTDNRIIAVLVILTAIAVTVWMTAHAFYGHRELDSTCKADGGVVVIDVAGSPVCVGVK